MPTIKFENQYLRLSVGFNGKSLSFADKQTGKEYCTGHKQGAFACVNRSGRAYPASQIQPIDGGLRLSFGDSGVQADISVMTHDCCLMFEVVGINDPQVDELLFANFYLNLSATPEDDFAACALALNLKTNVPEMPGLNKRLRAIAYRKLGIIGAKVAVIGCPLRNLRPVIKEIVSAAEELPCSPVGGAWALEAARGLGSFIFDTGDISENNVATWIRLVKSLGFTQVDFHGGKSFRFGDCAVNPELYPRGWDSFKAVIDKLHAAGIGAILHTYSFCIDKKCAWVTPIPDARLAADFIFTLAGSIDASAGVVPVVESTGNMSAVAGEHLPRAGVLQNSVVLRIDDELMIYGAVNKQPPYGFACCQRGALGTRPAAHAQGAKAHHLKECFRYFVPDGESSLFAETAKCTADFFNYCGFDAIYLDALDGETVFGGKEFGWHYGAKFVYELFRRLKKPALMEMATFHHHLWHLRSRVGAWDHPFRGYKRFIDYHVASNTKDQRMFMPGHLGWWTIRLMPWNKDKIKAITDMETEFTDDVEYLCGKALATDANFSVMGIDPDNIVQNETIRRKAEIIRCYETLRQSGTVAEATRETLRQPGVECVLTPDTKGKWRLKQAEYIKQKTAVRPDGGNLQVRNDFDHQPLQMRLELLTSAGSYDAPDSVVLDDFNGTNDFTGRENAPGVESCLQGSSRQARTGLGSLCYRAMNKGSTGKGAWSKIGRIYKPDVNLAGHEALGGWIYGDGQGEVLNFQLRNSEEAKAAFYWDRCVMIDFIGWKYIELIEPDTEYYANYKWPYFFKNSLMEMPSDPEDLEVLAASSRHLYRAPYHVFGGMLDYAKVREFNLWYNNLPPGKTVECHISPVKALPLINTKLLNPRVEIAGKEIIFPVEMETGQYLEFYSMTDCKLYKPDGKLICEIRPQGICPELISGDNSIRVAGESGMNHVDPRAQITIFARGDLM